MQAIATFPLWDEKLNKLRKYVSKSLIKPITKAIKRPTQNYRLNIASKHKIVIPGKNFAKKSMPFPIQREVLS